MVFGNNFCSFRKFFKMDLNLGTQFADVAPYTVHFCQSCQCIFLLLSENVEIFGFKKASSTAGLITETTQGHQRGRDTSRSSF